MKSVRSVLFLLLLTGLVLMLAVCGVTFWSGDRLQQQARVVFVAKDLTADILPPPMYLIEARLVVSQALEGTMSVGAATTEFERLAGEYAEREKYWQEHPPFGLEQQFGPQHEAAQAFIEMVRTGVLKPLRAGEADTARAALANAHALYEVHRRGVDLTVKASEAFADANAAKFEAVSATTTGWVSAALVCAVVAFIGMYLLVWRRLKLSFARPLQLACEAAELIATGDLTQEIAIEGRDEAAKMLGTLSAMQQALRRLIDEVRTGVESIAIASVQIAQGNSELSSRTERQASHLQQTTSTMEQIRQTVTSSTERARAANGLASGASEMANRGGQVVRDVVTSMKDIESASGKIVDIIGVIDGIAFQTNILALNAAVEAARAGEHGRGFAVVASEVRGLAQRCASAAREVKGLIERSSDGVEAGSRLVEQAGRTMRDIVEGVHEVGALINEISAAAGEQTTGIVDASRSMGDLDQMTQQNAALVEEVAAASEGMREQTARLTRSIAVFRVDSQVTTSSTKRT